MSRKGQIFKDTRLQQRYDRDGFVKVPFLSAVEMDLLIKAFHEKEKVEHDFDLGYKIEFRSSIFNGDINFKRSVTEKVSELIHGAMDKYLIDYKVLVANTFEKDPGTGYLSVHSNGSYVDESKYTSLTIWIPLQDTDTENGTLKIVPGSHDVFGKIRPAAFGIQYYPIEELIMNKYAIPVYVRKGEAVIFDDSMPHGSDTNNSPSIRKAFQIEVIPQEAPILNFHYNQALNKIEVFEVDQMHYLTHSVFDRPEIAKLLDTREPEAVKVEEALFLKKLSHKRPDLYKLRKKGIGSILADFFFRKSSVDLTPDE